MRRVAYAIAFAAIAIVVGPSSCTSTTGHACKSAGGTCLYDAGGGPACAKQAMASAQDCTSNDAPGWICCLDVEEPADGGDAAAPVSDAATPIDASSDALAQDSAPVSDGGTPLDGAIDAPADAPTGDGPTEASETDAGEAEDATVD